MSYWFRCDGCCNEVPVDQFDRETRHRNCEDCGQDGCNECLSPTELCDSCVRSRAEDEDTELEDTPDAD